MRVGLDIHPLAPPFTGISNYELWTLLALVPRAAGISFVGFGALRWSRVDADFLARQAVIAGKATAKSASADAETPEAGSRRPRLSRLVRAIPGGHAAAARLRALAFGTTVRAQDIDVFHAFLYRAPSERLHRPTIPVVYDLSHLRYPKTHPPQRLRFLRSVGEFCRDAPCVHTISLFSAREIEHEFGVSRSRIVVLPPAVDSVYGVVPDEGDRAILDRLDLVPYGYALTVATLEPRKNLATLLAAYDGLRPAERRRMPLVAVGAKGWGGVERDILLERMRAEGTLRLTGYLPDRAVAALYRNCRTMLFPSLYEGFGMPVLEALACGAPVVASSAGAVPEAACGAARLIDPLEVGGWRSAVRESAETRLHEDVPARLSRHRAATRWTWDDVAEGVLAMYRRLWS